jgi:fatty-acyl-CoA synthase
MKRPESETLAALLDGLAEAVPDDLACADGERERTFAELRERADRVTAGLQQWGIEPGDSVAVLMENRVEWVETMFGALRAGATVVGVSTWAKPHELEYFLAHSGADAVVSTASFLDTDFASVLDDLTGYGAAPPGDLDSEAFPALDTVVLLGADRPGAVGYDDLLAAGGPVPVPVAPEDVALLLYTSGSTSRPKGVPLLHGGVVENGYHIGERMHLGRGDRVWLASPLFWSYGSANALCALFTHLGGVVLQAPFEPERAIDLIDAYDCTVYYGMANMARALVRADGFAPERVRFRTGTTIGPPEDIAFTMDDLGVPELCNVYGSTETYGNCAVTDCKHDRETRLHTQGRPLPGQEVVVVDPETGERLGAGEVGELCVGGRITPGYHDAPEENREAFDADGYLHMGDLGSLTPEGVVQYAGRLKNVIKTGGINVSPAEVEAFVRELPGVDQVYVFGYDDPEKGELVGAVVVPSAADLTEDAVREHCRELSAYKRPTTILIREEAGLPTTDTGKIQRSALSGLLDGGEEET